MNKLGILSFALVGAFLIGGFTFNPFVEAANGWKHAVQDLQAQIDAIPSTSTVVNLQDTNDPDCEVDPDFSPEWCPESDGGQYRITDPSVTLDSVITATISSPEFGEIESIGIIAPGSFLVSTNAIDGSQLNYVVFNP